MGLKVYRLAKTEFATPYSMRVMGAHSEREKAKLKKKIKNSDVHTKLYGTL